MRFATLLATSVSLAALAAAPAHAQPPSPANEPAGTETAAAEDPGDADIVVTGLRASLESAQNVKRLAPQVVDAIVASDIGKLPDLAVSDTVGRLPGVQVYRQAGEASRVLIRGLPDFATTYNGREISRPPTSPRWKYSRRRRPTWSRRASPGSSTSARAARSTSKAGRSPARSGGCTRCKLRS
jgi:hypothetical protein